jgi:putative NIF3 family GTP cyclohydrolase 1 type 2
MTSLEKMSSVNEKMERRKFIRLTGAGSAGILLASPRLSGSGYQKTLTVRDINTHLRSLIDVNEPSVDRIVIGNPDMDVSRIGTAWMPYWETLKQAHAAGVNVMVVHEPAFYTHWDLDADKWDYYDAPPPARENYFTLRDQKKRWLEEQKIAIIRCHDVLDKIPEWGIPFAFGKALGFENKDIIRSKTYYNVYGIKTKPAIEVARAIAAKLKLLDQPGIAFYGDKNYPVSSVGLGTGCISDPLDYAELAPDLYIAIDDSVRTWTQTTFAIDSGKPLVVVNHGTSEEAGVRALNAHLKEIYKEYEVIHFNEGCTYRWIN